MVNERSEKQLAADKRLGDAAKLRAARKLIAAADAAAGTEQAFEPAPIEATAVEEINRTARSADTRENGRSRQNQYE